MSDERRGFYVDVTGLSVDEAITFMARLRDDAAVRSVTICGAHQKQGGEPGEGDLFQHFKGGIYEFVGIARHSETREHMAIYKSFEHGTLNARPMEGANGWSTPVYREKYEGPRFTLLRKATDIADRTFRSLQHEMHEISVGRGWHKKKYEEPTDPELLKDLHVGRIAKMLVNIVGEVSEGWEDVRRNRAMNEVWYEDDGKPCGVPSELADVVIRAMDTAESFAIDLYAAIVEKAAYNRKRPERHGGKAA